MSSDINMADNDQLFNLTSLLFGNIDENGRLEDDILDEDCKKHLNSLGKLGLQPILNEIIGIENIKNEDNIDANCDKNDNFLNDVKSPSAQDYSEENELATEEINVVQRIDTDYMNGVLEKKFESSTPPPLVPVSKPTSVNTTEETMENRKRKLETPLAAMLPEKYANVDVRQFFPDFRFAKVSNHK